MAMGERIRRLQRSFGSIAEVIVQTDLTTLALASLESDTRVQVL